MSGAMTGHERMRAAFARREPDCVPVSPDLSAMVPLRLAGRPFDEMFLDGLPHHGYASASVAQAYVEAVLRYGLDGWYIYGGLEETIPPGRPNWESHFAPLPGGGQVRRQVAHTLHGELSRRTIYPPDAPPWEVEKPVTELRRDWPRLRALMGEDGDWRWQPGFSDRERIGELGAYAVAISIPQDWWFFQRQGGYPAMFYDLADEGAFMREVFEFYSRYALARLRAAVAANPDEIVLGGSASSLSASSPAHFRRYDLPSIQEAARICRSGGVASHLHVCGRSRLVVEKVAEESDVDVVEPLEGPPPMVPGPWPDLPLDPERFRRPPAQYGILPFWFLDGELDPVEMRFQLKELRDKGMAGVILHGRFGLEMPYLGSRYLERIRLASEEAARLGLQTWIYDEMNWPSGTAGGRVLAERPDLAQRYLECVSLTIRGPWFTYLTGGDSRYLDFQRSTPVAAYALGAGGRAVDLTPNLSFTNVIPWQAPPGEWKLLYILEKRADYYIDALDPEATAEFLRLGYEPYTAATAGLPSGAIVGYYTDEPAMHYYLSGGDNPVVPWTKDMFRRFQERNGYSLRPRLPDLFYDLSPDSARVRYDYYSTLTEFYSEAYYRQLHDWCHEHGVLLTGHLLYEEWLRKLIRVEGNLYRHYPHLDVPGVDHLYPIIGDRDRADEHVAIKVASSAAHQLGRPRLLCESFGGIFMDATMQRMKWIADWEYVLGVNLLNPHGFHYTLEGPRKRDWPPSMFYQYPWWRYYQGFSDYVARLSYTLTGGRHAARVAVLWPINAMFATYTPQSHNALADRMEADFSALTDLLLRAHYDFDYLDEDVLVAGELAGGALRVRDEAYELIILPPLTHIKLATLERLEQFVAQGGRLLGTVFLPDRAFAPEGLADISARVEALFGADPRASQQGYTAATGIEVMERAHPRGGRACFLRSYALVRQLPLRLQCELGHPGRPESPWFQADSEGGVSRYYYAPPGGARQEITAEVAAEREAVAAALDRALATCLASDVTIGNPELFCLHRVRDGRDLYFIANPTFAPQEAAVTARGRMQPMLWNPSTGTMRPIAPSQEVEGNTHFQIALPPTGSAFVVATGPPETRVVATNLFIEEVTTGRITGYAATGEGFATVARGGQEIRLASSPGEPPAPLELDGEWEFAAEGGNALVLGHWLATAEAPGMPIEHYAAPDASTEGWLPMVPGAWSYQLPAGPGLPYPIPVWYRATFNATYVPAQLQLIVDGFAGASWRVYVNGREVMAQGVRSSFDSQMRALEIGGLVRAGENVVAIRLVLTGPTDGLLDLLKLLGDFSLAERAGGDRSLASPRRTLRPAPWTEQGYPYFSGLGIYRRRFSLPPAFAGQRVFLEPSMRDDVVEVLVNGQSAGVRLWAPYAVEVTGLLRPGENVLELRVANTLVNLLEATARPSGLAGAPRLVAYRPYTFDLPA